MKILFVASELNPIAKIGGLADVIGALPKTLKKLGIDVRIAIPKYGIVDEEKYQLEKIAEGIKINFYNKDEKFDLYQCLLPASEVPVYFIDHQKYLGDNGIYFEKSAMPEDSLREAKRFTFFARSVLEIFEPLNWWPNVIHCHDWHVGILPFLLKSLSLKDKRYKKIAALFTVHNLEYQGHYEAKDISEMLDLPIPEKNIDQNKKINFLKSGLVNSDFINTVSPNYAKEILTKEYGAGLEDVLQKRKNELRGILNGIDTEIFNPENDPKIKYNYSIKSLEIKEKNKLYLQEICGLKQDSKIPLFGLVGRLAEQKGIDLISEIMDEAANLNCQMVFLGTGESKYENALRGAEKKYPEKIKVFIKFDAKLAQEIYAGCDIFLMPSRFEPCGLGQMISMRYGTIPLVRATGGLKDSVKNFQFSIFNIQSTGFVFEKYDHRELLKTIKKALLIFKNKKIWRKMQINGMSQNFSWQKSAKEYIKVYEKLKVLNNYSTLSS